MQFSRNYTDEVLRFIGQLMLSRHESLSGEKFVAKCKTNAQTVNVQPLSSQTLPKMPKRCLFPKMSASSLKTGALNSNVTSRVKPEVGMWSKVPMHIAQVRLNVVFFSVFI